MKNSKAFFIILFLSLLMGKGIAGDIKFVSQPADSLSRQTYCWQPRNRYRPIIDLQGQWEYRINADDPYQKVVLPASCDYSGEITFRKKFVPDSSLANHFFRLICYGINYYCMIFVNDKLIATHSGGYSSFAFDIPEGVIKINRRNTLEIKVDTRLDSKNTIPHRLQPRGIRNTAGIFRPLYLLAIPEMSVENVAVSPQFSPDFSRCELEVNFEVKDRINDSRWQQGKRTSPSKLYYYIEVSSKGKTRPMAQQWKEIDAQSYELTRQISTTLLINQPQLWSPDAPFLYSFRIQLVRGKQIIDQYDQSLGFKQVKFQDGDILLNGKRITLKGVNWVEDYLIDGAVFDRDRLLQDLALIKQLHANAIRVLNHPAHPYLTSVCDSLGLLLLQEIPLNWIPTKQLASENLVNQANDYFRELMQRDRANVSVLAWGIGGPYLTKDASSRQFINKLIRHHADFARLPIYFWNYPGLFSGDSDSNLIAGVDAIGMEHDQLQSTLKSWTRQNPDQVHLVLSYGAPQLGAGSKTNHNVLYEEYQVLGLVESWRAIAGIPEIDGYFVSTLSDYRGNYPSPQFKNCIEGELRPFGLTDYRRKKRTAYETVRSLYQEGKSRYNPGVSLQPELPAIFLLVGMGTLLVFLFILNRRRYFRENLKRIFVHPHGFYVDIRDGRKVPVSHTILMALSISVGSGLVLASILSFVKNIPHIDHLITLLAQTPALKSKICYLSWNYRDAVIVFSIISLLLFFLLAIYFKFFAIITRKRCSLAQCFTIPFWIGGNLIFLIPLGMILYRLFQYEQLVIPIFVLIAMLVIWTFFRVIKGMRVLFIWTFRRAFIVLSFSILIIAIGLGYYYQSHFAWIDYVKFYVQLYGAHLFSAAPY